MLVGLTRWTGHMDPDCAAVLSPVVLLPAALSWTLVSLIWGKVFFFLFSGSPAGLVNIGVFI